MRTTILAATAALSLAASGIAQAEELRLSHQWSNKDVRHKVAEIVANEVAAANVDLEIKIFGSKSLFKPREQYKPLSRGQLDMTVFPLSYAGGQQPAFNLTLMPGLVKNHDHAARLNESEFMGKLEAKMAEDDVMVLVHGYLAGGFVGKDKCITNPDDVKGLQTRAAGKAFEQMLVGAGACGVAVEPWHLSYLPQASLLSKWVTPEALSELWMQAPDLRPQCYKLVADRLGPIFDQYVVS